MEENLRWEEFFLPKAINSSQRKKLVKNFWIELLVVTSWYNYLILALWAELLSALRANSNSTQRPKKLLLYIIPY